MIRLFEDPDDYRVFEQAVTADYDAETAVEREAGEPLVATSIETGLFRVQTEMPTELSRIAQLDQRTALPDQCLHSAEADVRPPRRKSGFGLTADLLSATFREVDTARRSVAYGNQVSTTDNI